MCLRLAWRREEGNTHRVSQACPEHEPSTSTTFKYTHKHTHSHYTCTPAVPHLTHPYTHTHTGTAMYMLAVQRTDTRSNFYPAIMKFMQSHNGHVHSSSNRAENISSSLTRCLEVRKHRNIFTICLYLCDIFQHCPCTSVNMTVVAFREVFIL